MSIKYLIRLLSKIARQCCDPDTTDALDALIVRLKKRATPPHQGDSRHE